VGEREPLNPEEYAEHGHVCDAGRRIGSHSGSVVRAPESRGPQNIAYTIYKPDAVLIFDPGWTSALEIRVDGTAFHPAAMFHSSAARRSNPNK